MRTSWAGQKPHSIYFEFVDIVENQKTNYSSRLGPKECSKKSPKLQTGPQEILEVPQAKSVPVFRGPQNC